MTLQDRIEIMEVLEKIATLPLFKEYRKLYEEISENVFFVEQISLYRFNQEQYIQSHGIAKVEALEELKRSKAKLDTIPSLKEYFRIARQIELFLDDLNYSLNKKIITEKQSCYK